MMDTMEHEKELKERRKHPRRDIKLVLEYWEAHGTCHEGLVCNLSETGLLIHFTHDIPIGGRLNVRIYFSDGSKLGNFQGIARVVWKQPHCESGSVGYKCGLEFIFLTLENQRKLIELLDRYSDAFAYGVVESGDPVNIPVTPCRELLR
jgi:hypothetical protein